MQTDKRRSVFSFRNFSSARKPHCSWNDPIYQKQRVPWWVSLAKGRYKYIRTMEDNQIEELYDLVADPDELNNLALDPAHSGRLSRFRRNTIKELKRTKAGLVKQLPPVRIAHQ